MLSLLILLSLAAAFAVIAEYLLPRMDRVGLRANTAAGIAGAMAGQTMFGNFGPAIAGVSLFPALLGASIVIYCFGLFHGPVCTRSKETTPIQKARHSLLPCSFQIASK